MTITPKSVQLSDQSGALPCADMIAERSRHGFDHDGATNVAANTSGINGAPPDWAEKAFFHLGLAHDDHLYTDTVRFRDELQNFDDFGQGEIIFEARCGGLYDYGEAESIMIN